MYYKIPYGKAFLSISKTDGFQFAQLVYDDYDNHVYNISRDDIVGKSLVQLFEDTNKTIEKIFENRKTFSKLTKDLVKLENEAYTPEDLIIALNQIDKELVHACSMPKINVCEQPKSYHMRFKLKDGASILFNLNEKIGFTSLHVEYEDGYTYTLVRNQLICSPINDPAQLIKMRLKITAKKREDFLNIVYDIFKENPASDFQELLATLKKCDPLVCSLCNIT